MKSLSYDCIEMIFRGLQLLRLMAQTNWCSIVPWGKLVIELDNNIFGGFTISLPLLLLLFNVRELEWECARANAHIQPSQQIEFSFRHSIFCLSFGCQHNDRHKYIYTHTQWERQRQREKMGEGGGIRYQKRRQCNLAFVFEAPIDIAK